MAETDEARHEREVGELLNEIRVALPGVQVLFAFLLSVPFSQRFTQLTHNERQVYYTAFIASAVASVLFIAPSVFARLTWRHHDKERLLVVSNAFVIAGSVGLAVAIGCAVYVVSDILFHSVTADVATAAVVALTVATWFVLPLYDRVRRDSQARATGGTPT
jgi:MFS family permease